MRSPFDFKQPKGTFLTEALLDTAEELGIVVDLTVEPGLLSKKADTSFGAYATAPSTDFIEVPKTSLLPLAPCLAYPVFLAERALAPF